MHDSFVIMNCMEMLKVSSWISCYTFDCREMGIPVVSEAWLIESLQKKEKQPLEAYDVVSDLVPEGRGIAWDKQESSEESLESLTAEVTVSGTLSR